MEDVYDRPTTLTCPCCGAELILYPMLRKQFVNYLPDRIYDEGFSCDTNSDELTTVVDDKSKDNEEVTTND